MRFEVAHIPSSQIASEPVRERKTYWVAGLFPTREVDVRARCPNGAVAVTEETTFVDGLLGVVTLSIYAPRTSYYWCRSVPYVAPAPPVAPQARGAPP